MTQQPVAEVRADRIVIDKSTLGYRDQTTNPSYRVYLADTHAEAIALLKSGEPIALVFSDILMPGGMTGYDVAEWVQSMKPEVKVLQTTGYSEMPVAVSETVRKVQLLGKPYTREQLACALREALDG